MSAAPPVLLRINAGGEAYTDSLARPFAADAGFAGGTIGQTSSDASGTEDPTLFGTWREGAAFSFHQAVANGNYAIWLEFADFGSTAAGQRLMDVWAEGGQVLDNYDVFAAAGSGAATARCANVNINDGALDLSFAAVAGEAMVSAIVLIPTDAPVEAQPYPIEGGYVDSVRDLHSQANLRLIGQTIFLYANDNRGHYPSDFGQLFRAQSWSSYAVFANPRTSTALPRGETSFVEQLAWVRDHSDYLYLPGLRLESPPTEVMAYENPTRLAGSINVLFADGHVEEVDRNVVAQLIGFDPNVPTDPAPVWPNVTADPAVLQSQTNLRQIGGAMQDYSADHSGGRYPVTMSALYQGYQVPISAFANPRGTTVVPELSGDAAVAWIDASTDYIYLGAGMSYGSVLLDTLLIYERPAPMEGGINLAFANGNVEFREMRWAMETLARATGGYGMDAIHNPIANIAGRYTTQQGVPIQVTGAGVRALQSTPFYTHTAIPIAVYEWDWDYDGTTFHVDATGQSPVVPADRLHTVGTRSIALRVRDAAGYESSIATASLTVTSDTTAPTVTAVYVKGSTWSSNFLSFLADNIGGSSALYGYAIPVGSGDTQLQTLPWRNLNQISIAFSEDVSIAQAQFAIVGSVGSYNVSGFSYNATDHVATWSLSAVIGADRLYIALPGSGASPVKDAAGNALDGEWSNPASYSQVGASDTFPSGNGVAGGDFAFRFDVLPGDSTGGNLGKVNVADINQTKSRSSLPETISVYRSDFDGNGLINVADITYVKSRSSISSLPVDPPVLPLFSTVSIWESLRIICPQWKVTDFAQLCSTWTASWWIPSGSMSAPIR